MNNFEESLPELSKIHGVTFPKQKLERLKVADPFNNHPTPEVLKSLNSLKSSDIKTAKSKSLTLDKSMFTMYSALDVVEPKYNLAALAMLYDTNPYHAAAVDAKADSVVGLGFKFIYTPTVERELEKASADSKESEDDEKVGKKNTRASQEKKRKLEVKYDVRREILGDIIDKMADGELQELLYKIYKDRCVMGNAFIEVGRNANGEIGYIGHVSPLNIRVRRKRDGFIQMINGDTVFFRKFGDTETPNPLKNDPNPNELIHIKQYSPLDDYYGIPEITASLTAIMGLEYAEKYNIDYFENKAVPRYIIKAKGMAVTNDAMIQLNQFFEDSIKNKSHRTIIVPIPQGGDKDIDFQAVETQRQEGNFSIYMNQCIQSIMSRHRVPSSRIGLTAASTSQGEAKESEKTFKETVCQPEQRNFERKINMIVKEITDMFFFKLNEYTLTDEDTRSQIAERHIRSGVLLPDEVRQRDLNLGPRADGDGDEPLDIRAISIMSIDSAADAANKDVSQAKANNKSNALNTRVRDHNRQSDNPDKNSNNRNPRRTMGEGRAPGK